MVWILWPSAVVYPVHSEVEEQLCTDRVVSNPHYNGAGPELQTAQSVSMGMVIDNPFYRGYLQDIVYPESPPRRSVPQGSGGGWRGIDINSEVSSAFTSTEASTSIGYDTSTDDSVGYHPPHRQHPSPHPYQYRTEGENFEYRYH
jgi:hypothetical protein